MFGNPCTPRVSALLECTSRMFAIGAIACDVSTSSATSSAHALLSSRCVPLPGCGFVSGEPLRGAPPAPPRTHPPPTPAKPATNAASTAANSSLRFMFSPCEMSPSPLKAAPAQSVTERALLHKAEHLEHRQVLRDHDHAD